MGRHGARLRWVVALVSVTVAVLATVDRYVEREREWAHGGDPVAVTIEARLPEPGQVADVTAALGWPDAADRVRDDPEEQSVVLRLRWSGPERAGHYQIILLDRRHNPARVLPADGGWDAAGSTGSNWSDAYEVLADRYDWLAGTASREEPDGSVTSGDYGDYGAIGTQALGDGSLIAIFRLGPAAAPVADPAQLLVAFCYVEPDGDLRWAKRVPVPPSA